MIEGTEQAKPAGSQPILVAIGGPDDDWNHFPSTTTYAANRTFELTGKQTQIRTMGVDVINFIQRHCVLTDSHYAKSPFKLMDWQKRLILEMYEVRIAQDPVSGVYFWKRIFAWAMVGIPKKNGKTELAAALGLYHMFDDEASPNVICAAASDDQADLVYGAARKMCQWSPTLSGLTETGAKKITIPTKAGAQFIRVAASSGTNDGKNVYVTIIDELHEWIKPKARDIFTVLTQGGGARRQPLNIMITTAGFDQDSICYEFYEHGKDVRDGVVSDPTLYFCWFEAPEDSNFRDPKVWEAANPSWGLILQQDFYEDIITKRAESEFCRYFLNMWTEAEEIWEAAALWDDIMGDPVMSPDRKTFVGIDIGRRHDTCAVVWVQWDDDKGRVQVKQKIWKNPYRKNTSQYKDWRMSVADVEVLLRELADEYKEPSAMDEEDGMLINGPAFLFDPHFFHRSAEILEEEGLNMIEFPQTDTRMVPASSTLFEMIKMGELEHDGDPEARKQIRAVIAKERERGWRISKPAGSKKPIDFAVALAMPVHAASALLDDGYGQMPNVW